MIGTGEIAAQIREATLVDVAHKRRLWKHTRKI